MRHRTAIINSVLVLLLAAAGGGAYLLLGTSGASGASTGPARTVAVERGTVLATVSASGTVVPSTTTEASFGTSGTVSAVDVQVGQHVTRGQTLAKLDPSTADEQLTQAQQQLTTAEAQLTAAQDNLTSVEDGDSSTSSSPGSSSGDPSSSGGSGSSSRGSGASTSTTTSSTTTTTVSAASIAQAQAEVDQDQDTVDSDQAQVTNDKQAVQDTVLTAPLSGTVVAVNGTVGSSAGGSGTSSTANNSSSSSSSSNGSPGSGSNSSGSGSSGSTSTSTSTTTSGSSSDSSSGSGFVEIANLSKLEISAEFSETDTAKLKVGQTATVTFDALPGVQAAARLIQIDPTSTTDNNVVDYGATFSIIHPPSGLKDGQTATISVVTAEATSALYLPTSAIQTSGAGDTVTVMRDGHKTNQTVELGVQGSNDDQILSGVTEGERIVLPTTTGSSGFPGGGFIRPGGLGGGVARDLFGGAARG